jgi:3-isopropylmalate dehydratase small subunit
VKEGEPLAVDLKAGLITLASGATLPIQPFPAFMERIVQEGGWMPYLVKQYGR